MMEGRKAQNSLRAQAQFKYVVLLLVLMFLRATSLEAQEPAAQGSLAVTATVQSSISLVFENNPSVGSAGFCPLTNAGTNNVGLDLGTASFPTKRDSLPCVSYSRIGRATYQVSSAFDVVVSEANTTSPSYQLAAQISTAPPANVVWLVNGTPLTSTGFTNLDASESYGAPVTKTLAVQVKNNVRAQILTETITFEATAN